MSRSVRRRLYLRLRRRGRFWQEPIISPYTDRLRDRVIDGHQCRPFIVLSDPPPAERPPGWFGRWPTVCGRCGHRHAGAPCASHVWDDPCEYDAGADCTGVGLRPLPPYRPEPDPRRRCAP